MNAGPLRVLVVDDSDDDALLLVRALRKGQYAVTWKRADTPEMLAMLLHQERWDVLFADYALPKLSALAALRIVKDSGQDVPFIVVSGVVNEEIAVSVMRAGAHDFLAKNKLTRLVPAVARELRDATLRHERSRSAAGVRLLNEAGVTLIASLDYADTLDRASRIAVPAFADHCYIDIRGEDQIVRRVAIADADPAREVQLRAAANGFQPGWEATDPAGQIFVTGLPVVDGTRSFLILPMRLRGTSLGAIGFVMTDSGRLYSEDDITVAEELARRIAMALDNSRLYAAEKRAHVEAEGALRARDNFLSVASHELRTPVTIVKCAAELLLSGFAEGPVPESEVVSRLQTIKSMSDRLTLLIADLLDVSRLRTGQFQLRMERNDLARLTREVVDQYHMQLGAQYPLTFTTTDVPAPINVDRHRLQQTLSNVLENAIKYSPEGGRIDVCLRVSGSGVLLTVSDQGIGLPPEATRTIFEPFGRGSNAQRRQVPGMGLGLYIARQIVDQHGGRMWAYSAGEGCGTLVSIWLPNATDQVLAAEWPSAAAEPLVPARSRILVVEDESAVRHTLRDALELEGYECRVAVDGRDALNVLAGWSADIIVLDLMMPVMDGRTFRREQRANPALCDIPIVVVSAVRPNAARVAELGAAAIFPKPFELDHLLEALADIIAA